MFAAGLNTGAGYSASSPYCCCCCCGGCCCCCCSIGAGAGAICCELATPCCWSTARSAFLSLTVHWVVSVALKVILEGLSL